MALSQQFFLLKRQRTFWLVLSLFAIIIIANWLSLFKNTNAFFYTQLQQLTHSQQSDVVLIESAHLSQEHSQLVKQLLSYQPKTIIVVANEQLTVNSQIASNSQVYYPHPNNTYCLSDIINWSGYNLAIETTPRRACRSLWQQLYPTAPKNEEVLLNFALAPAALPKFSATRLMTMDIMASQLQDKVVILGQQSAGMGVMLSAPKLHHSSNYLLLTAYMADTFEKQNAISSLANWQSILLQLLIALALLFLFQKVSVSYSALAIILISCLWLVIGYFSLIIEHLFLPVGQMILLSIFTLFWVILVRKLSEDSDLIILIHNIQQKMAGRYLPKAFIAQTTPWDSIIRLVNQQLDLNKSIFLARKEGDHRLEEIRAVNCELTDIQEMRRDYKRAPYSDALKAFGAVPIKRAFFTELNDDEIQYIVPLTFAGDVRGFWAMTITPNSQFNQQAFEKNVNAFAGQVGELLFHYRIYESQSTASNKLLSQLLTLKLREPLSQQVKVSIAEMEQKLTTLEHVFNNIRSATVLFNLFGQVVQINKSLETLAARHQFSIFEMTALDLICLVTNVDTETAKGKLRYITLQKGEVYFEANLDGQTYVLNVRAIDSSSIQSASGEPFQVSGILFEFIDIGFFIKQMPNSKQLCESICEQQRVFSEQPTEQAHQ